MLQKQNITHPTAGAFLHTLKTLMEKLKVDGFNTTVRRKLIRLVQANDWGALDREYDYKPISNVCHSSPDAFAENLASHRVEILSRSLRVALAHGLAEIEPDKEPLKVLSVHVNRSDIDYSIES
jgi:hypothetical protein